MEPKLLDAIAKVIDASAWPLVALAAGAALFWKAPAIISAVKRAPLIRKIGFQGFEIELDLKDLDELQDQTDKTLIALVQKTDKQIQRIVRMAGLAECLENFGNRFYRDIPIEDKSAKASGRLRCTVHINDAVFSEYLYQACNYYIPWTGIYQSLPRTSGRRFSIRYGIIGLAARTKKTQMEGNALSGSEEEIANLISHWSMTHSEAESAKSKPSCLAIALRDPSNSSFLGLFYADAIDPYYFGDQKDFENFLKILMDSEEYKGLCSCVEAVHKAISQIQIAIDLNEIENLRS